MRNRDLGSILASRLCHDLISPVGAIVNGIDLMREIGAGALEPELAMMSQSAERASRLLQFYRIAFGAADEDSADLVRLALYEEAAKLIATPRIRLDWPEGAHGPTLPRPHARLLCQLLLCARAIVGMAGSIKVRLPVDALLPMSITVAGGQSATGGLNADLVELLSNPREQEPTPRHVEFALVHSSANALDLQIAVDRTGDELAIVADRV